MNRSVKDFLTEAERDLKEELPHFDAATLIGKNIDVFHKNPSHQRQLLGRLSSTHRATIRIGTRVFDLIANPIFDRARGRIGTVVEWSDAAQRLLNLDYSAQIAAIGKSQAVIEFNLDGSIITANATFLREMGYSLQEIVGKHHSMFVDPTERDRSEYKAFWASLNRGEYQAAEYKRIGKGGREVFIQASYNPILDLNGKPWKVVKFATDVTEQVIARKRSERVREMMDSVAAGAEELSSSVREIAETMVKSAATANDAVGRVEAADQATHRLAEAAAAMSGIVDLISNIAGQINLLALNATIESARAGEAGRGFAVVATEVKNLANQAKGATERISKEILGMRGISDEVVGALSAIKQSIESVREYVMSTTSAVEEQSAVAAEMSGGMQKAAAEASAIGGR